MTAMTPSYMAVLSVFKDAGKEIYAGSKEMSTRKRKRPYVNMCPLFSLSPNHVSKNEVLYMRICISSWSNLLCRPCWLQESTEDFQDSRVPSVEFLALRVGNWRSVRLVIYSTQ